MSPSTAVTVPRRIARAQPGEHRRAGVDADDVDAARRRAGWPGGRCRRRARARRAPLAGQLAASSTTTSALTSTSLMPGVPLVVDVGERVAVRSSGVALHRGSSTTARLPAAVGTR